MTTLTIDLLAREARIFAEAESAHPEPKLYGVTDGKAVGTYLELKFRAYLIDKGYAFEQGNAASGLDFPDLGVDMKVTSIKQPQSSCPFRSTRQKIYGLGYSLLVFAYEKFDDSARETATLWIRDVIFVEAASTADYQMTKGLRDVLDNDGNEDDLMAFMASRNLTEDEVELRMLAEMVMRERPSQGYLTISPALQWRLNYTRVIEKAGQVRGIHELHRGRR
ncbi:MAG: restriction endonuclease [Polyangiales bacterium]